MTYTFVGVTPITAPLIKIDRYLVCERLAWWDTAVSLNISAKQIHYMICDGTGNSDGPIQCPPAIFFLNARTIA
jgi:hypothetical protein